MQAAIKTIPGVSFYGRLKQASNMFIKQPQSMRQFLLAITFALTCTAASAQNAYVANSSKNTISVINTKTNIVTAKVYVGKNPFGVSVGRNGSKVYVAN